MLDNRLHAGFAEDRGGSNTVIGESSEERVDITAQRAVILGRVKLFR